MENIQAGQTIGPYQIIQQIGQGGMAHVLTLLGGLEVRHGAYARATDLYQESLKLREQMGDQDGIASIFDGLAAVAAAQDDLLQAVRMASQNPAEYLGLGDQLGRIAPGYRANLVLADDGLNVAETWIDGLTAADVQDSAPRLAARP